MALKETGKPVVLVLVNGRPLTVNWEDENLPSILEMWFPNCEGGNILAETLFGENNPSGKITVTFPKSIGQIEYNFPYKKGSHGGQRRSGDPNGTGISRVIGPLYPFGHGLSYTTFAYSDLSVSASDGKGMTVTATVTNTGKRAGGEVVQLYVRDKVSSVVTYDSVLRGFEKVFLEPGESEKVSFTLTLDDLSLVGKDLERVFEPGEFDIMIGSSSNDIRLSMTVGLQ
jgi:Glycosyl hydrolase family 3 C terminal domain.